MSAARRWMWATLLVTLVTGAGLGVLVDRLVLLPTVHSSARDGSDRRGEHREHGRRLMETLRAELELSEDQAAALEEVMSANHETARSFWRESRREFDTLRQRFRSDIRALLTEEQNERFDRLLAERDARHQERERD